MSDSPDIPTFEELAADPEIAPLLEFEPVPRKFKRADGWNSELQRELIARIAATGAIQAAVDQMGKFVTGAKGLYKAQGADSFRRAWDAALRVGRRRNGRDRGPFYTGPIPGIEQRYIVRKDHVPGIPADLQELDYREALDYERRAAARWDESTRQVRDKVFMCRRFYLLSIADDPERRAAWELLCGPADWDAARDMQAQPDEDREPVSLDELRTASWQVPLKTGFVPAITDPARALAGSTLERLQESIRRNDPRYANRPAPGRGEGED